MVLPETALDVESILSIDPIDDPHSLNWPKRFIAKELGWIPTFDYERSDPHGLYGGQVIAQTVWAACHTVPDLFDVHSTHGHFLRPGNSLERIVYNVYEVRTGRGYATRRVEAVQFDKVIYTCFASFKHGISSRKESEDRGIRHGTPYPDDQFVPNYKDIPNLPIMPDIDMPNLREFDSIWEMPLRVQEVPVFENNAQLPIHSRRQLRFFQPRYSISNRSHNFQAVYLMYASDRNFLFTATNAHEVESHLQYNHVASLDHSFIVHVPLGLPSARYSYPSPPPTPKDQLIKTGDDEDGDGCPGWITYETKSPASGDQRCLTTGIMWDKNGRHIASVMQDALSDLVHHGQRNESEDSEMPDKKLSKL